MMADNNTRSDIRAKQSFAQYLADNGYTDVKLITQPADILAKKNNQIWYFEIKSTSKTKYFGAATETEWAKAIDTPENYRFVIIQSNEDKLRFKIYTPEEFMEFSTIPPFKVYFNVELDSNSTNWTELKEGYYTERETCKRETTSIKMKKATFEKIHELFKELSHNKQ